MVNQSAIMQYSVLLSFVDIARYLKGRIRVKTILSGR